MLKEEAPKGLEEQHYSRTLLTEWSYHNPTAALGHIHVCMHACMHVCMYVYTYTYTYAYTYTYIYIHIYIYIYLYGSKGRLCRLGNRVYSTFLVRVYVG